MAPCIHHFQLEFQVQAHQLTLAQEIIDVSTLNVIFKLLAIARSELPNMSRQRQEALENWVAKLGDVARVVAEYEAACDAFGGVCTPSEPGARAGDISVEDALLHLNGKIEDMEALEVCTFLFWFRKSSHSIK